MIGMTESELHRSIDSGCLGTPAVLPQVKDHQALDPQDILRKLATAVAKTMSENNSRIERDLANKGILR